MKTLKCETCGEEIEASLAVMLRHKIEKHMPSDSGKAAIHCPRCGQEHEGYCAKCREAIKGRQVHVPQERLLPLLYWDTVEHVYRFACTVRGCPCNVDGLCSSKSVGLPERHRLHEFDGDNIILQVCG